MKVPTAIRHEQAWLAAVGELSRVNDAVEVHARSLGDGPAEAFNARVLEADAETGELVIERPPALPTPLLTVGSDVRLFIQIGGTRLGARSRVARTGRYRLNAETRVVGVALDPVTDVAASQRRARFRVPMLGDAAADVRLLHPDFPPVEATLLDLSETGAAVVCASTAAWNRAVSHTGVRVVLPLDQDRTPLEVATRVVRLDARPGGVQRLGLRFSFDSTAERQAAQRRLQEVAAHRQRLLLRRHRAAG